MTRPALTAQQLRATVERALSSTRPSTLVLVSGDPDAPPPLDEVSGRPVTVVGSASPLEIRRLARQTGDTPLVVVTNCESDELGDDLLARAASRRIITPDRWATVCSLFAAERPSRQLTSRAHLADALIEERPRQGYPPATSRVLDLDTALDALADAALGLPPAGASGSTVLAWLDDVGLPARWRRLDKQVRTDLTQLARERHGPAAGPVMAILDAARTADAMALALAAEAIHHPDATGAETSRALLERELARPQLEAAEWRALAAAAAERVGQHTDPSQVAGWLDRAETVLADLDATSLAHLSSVLRSGFEARLRRAADAIGAWRGGDGELERTVAERIDEAAQHRLAREEPHRVERLRMAARLAKRGHGRLDRGHNLVELARQYRADGAWLDAARVQVSRSDGDPSVAAVLDACSAAMDGDRVAESAALAELTRHAVGPLPEGSLGIESVLDEVVVPVAAARPVLLVVLDGMSVSVHHEVVQHLANIGWTPVVDDERRVDRPVLATLPTVTEVSRASLLAGRLLRGGKDVETREFAAHHGLVAASRRGKPPIVFHKTALRDGGLDTRPAEVAATIADPQQKVVAVVINNIDERLDAVDQPPSGWSLAELSPLRDLLAEARRAGRALIVTSDHGHVLERGGEHRSISGGGQRWRPADPPVGDGEIEVAGPRVLGAHERIVMPIVEGLRYTGRKNGYHGGLTPQELFVPLTVLTAEPLDGWTPAPVVPPSWWHLDRVAPPEEVAPPASAPQAAARRRPAGSDLPTLFDLEPERQAAPAESATAAGWIEQLLAEPELASRRASPRIRLTDDELERLLRTLDRWAGVPLPLERLANETELPVARINRYVAQVQDLLNVDGYGIVEVLNNEVRFQRDLLLTQFEL
ncbi:BREX-2 system phosphatase PglZ [Actinomarinicola tropica]|uniref:BREX-2 system phosphatase PglZ n=1 Tax=Actinomarinicola tropica TaxID=2789776 RepID=A0A5Q2RJ00_9ACTN|nr:BREX-2 system phosphatase PglZ [Actinomarinicola tropica]QGG94366.1 BREX-2 system phosphatase PglZ [Actinomarinicola tropica]